MPTVIAHHDILVESTDDPGIRPRFHNFVASRAPWEEIPDDGLPRFDESHT